MGLKLGLNLGYWGIGPQGEEATEPAPRLQPISWQRLSPSEEDLSRALKAVRRLRRRSGEWRSVLERL